jgi:hypothetical protein
VFWLPLLLSSPNDRLRYSGTTNERRSNVFQPIGISMQSRTSSARLFDKRLRRFAIRGGQFRVKAKTTNLQRAAHNDPGIILTASENVRTKFVHAHREDRHLRNTQIPRWADFSRPATHTIWGLANASVRQGFRGAAFRRARCESGSARRDFVIRPV